MISFLLGEGADATVVAANGDSALHSALHVCISTDDSVERLESVGMLVVAGCNLLITNSFGRTSLDIAVASGYISVVRYFLSLDVPLSPDIFLSACRCYYHDPVDFSVMVRLLLDHGADPNVNTPDGDNALHLAMSDDWLTFRIMNHDELEQYTFQVFKTLVEAGCDPSACNNNGRTVLHTAAAQGCMKIIEYLLSLGALIPPDILLFLSYSHTTTQSIQLLIDKGADIRAVTADGDTPLHLAVSGPESSALKFTELLIAAGSDPRAFNVAHKTPIHAAAAEGYISVIKYLLSLSVPLPPDILLTASAKYITSVVRFFIDNGVDTTVITADGDTALHLALGGRFSSSLFKLGTAKILIEAGCDINACNSAGHTPLHAAASCGHLDIIKYLLSQGASLSPDVFLAAATVGDIDVMEYILSQGSELSVPPGAFLAAASCPRSSNRVQAVLFLSTLDAADVRVVAPNGDTALHRAVKIGNSEGDCLETAKLLVRLGCHLSLCNSAGETPLHIAARRHHISVSKYLLSQGVPLPSDVLLSAASQPYVGGEGRWAAAMIRLLIREGANPCAVNDEGDTPLHVFLRRDFYEDAMEEWKVIQMLLDAGANPYARNLNGQTPVGLVEKPGPFFARNFMRLVKQAKAPIVPPHN